MFVCQDLCHDLTKTTADVIKSSVEIFGRVLFKLTKAFQTVYYDFCFFLQFISSLFGAALKQLCEEEFLILSLIIPIVDA